MNYDMSINYLDSLIHSRVFVSLHIKKLHAVCLVLLCFGDIAPCFSCLVFRLGHLCFSAIHVDTAISGHRGEALSYGVILSTKVCYDTLIDKAHSLHYIQYLILM